MLRIQLLGRIEIAAAGKPLPPLRGRSGLWLLGILALNANHSVERDWLAGVLWPESAPETGRANLRRTLTDLRGALGAAAARLENPTPQSVRLNLAADEVDALAFRAGALERYGGELLPGCGLEWVETERRALAEEFLARGEARAAELPSGEALPLLKRLRAADPLRESLLRLQLAALCGQGNRAEAQQEYHGFRRGLLESRLGEPSAQTQAHWAALQAPPKSSAPAASANLPVPLTPMLGRLAERDALLSLLESHRLVTVTGPGGIGKTRLAIEVARASERALFLELAEWRDVARLPETLNELLAPCGDGPILLALDNFEQLVGPDARRTLRGALEKRPGLRCLVTSRRALGITGEALFALEPLELPRHPGSPDRLGEFASVRLLVERARALRPDFRLTEENAENIVALCRRAEGIPLALELLAPHLRSLSPAALLDRMETARLSLLARRDDGETPRHRSLRHIVGGSLALLSEGQRAGFRRLSVFRGGWTLAAAEAVLGPDALMLLESLEDGSLIRSTEGGRYGQLETLREFAEETISRTERTAARAAHARFFLDFAELHADAPAGLSALDAERGNLVAAFENLLETGDTDSATRWARALRLYWYHRPGGQALLESLLGRLASPAERGALQENLGVICATHGDYDAARGYLDDALTHFRSTGDALTQAKILSNRAGMAIERGELEEARRGLDEALPLWRSLNQPRGLGATLNNLSIVAMNQGDLDASEPLIDEALALREAQGDSAGIATALINRGSLELRRGANRRAEAAYGEALRRFVELGDRRGEANALEGLAEVFLDRSDRPQALRFLQEVTWLRREYRLSETALQSQLYDRVRRALGEEAASLTLPTPPPFTRT